MAIKDPYLRTVVGVEPAVEQIRRISLPLGNSADLDPLMDRIGEARYALLGEASHGTSDFYTWRMRLSKRLILEKGFRFIAVEGDWPDRFPVNRCDKGRPDSGAVRLSAGPPGCGPTGR